MYGIVTSSLFTAKTSNSARTKSHHNKMPLKKLFLNIIRKNVINKSRSCGQHYTNKQNNISPNKTDVQKL